MPRPMTREEREAFLAEPHVAVLSVAGEDGRPPYAVPLWYHYRPGGEFTFFTTHPQGRPSRKTRLLERAGVLSLTVQREEPPYRYVAVGGTLLRTDRAPTDEHLLTIAGRYLPPEQAEGFVRTERDRPDQQLVLFAVRPDRWDTADFSEDGG